jgi:hypothetical protein
MTDRSESIDPCLCGERREDDCGHPDCPFVHPERRGERLILQNSAHDPVDELGEPI